MSSLIQEPLLKQECEPHDKCCLCLPISTGMKTFSYMSVVFTIAQISLGTYLICYDIIPGLLFFTIIIPNLASCYYFMYFLFIDNKEGS